MLEDIVNRTKPGARLPGIRELMRMSQCGRPVVEKELEQYLRDRRIVVRPRCGFFRAGVVKSPRKIIILHNYTYPSEGENFADNLFTPLRDLIETNGYEAGFVNFRDKEDDLRLVAEAFDTDKVFLVGCESIELAKIVHQITPFCVELMPKHDITLGSEVRDSPEMTSIQLNYLFERKFRKIGYLHHVEPERFRTPVEYHRLFDYYRIMAEHGFPVNPAWVLFAPWTWKEFERVMYDFFASGALPEVVIAPGSTIPFLYRFCGNNGIEIGKDIGVMGCDRYKYNFRAKVTTTTNDPVQIAETAWAVMKETIEGKTVSRTTTLQIQTGTSILPRS